MIRRDAEMSTQPRRSRGQGGFMLLEALIAIVIFSLGILGLLALQAVAVNNASAAKYRSDASFQAENLVGQMWVSSRTPAALQANFSSAGGGKPYAVWASGVAAALPGAGTYPPAVTVQPVTKTVAPSSVVTITIYWKAPNESATAPPHRYTLVAQII
jgi:type IV pilus assembly protein PilV